MKYSVKISNLSFDVDFEPIEESKPPIVDPELPPIVTPPPPLNRPKDYIYLDDFEGNVDQQFDKALKQEGKILRLNDDHVYFITEYEQQEPKLKAIVGRNTDLIFDTDVQEIFLFQNDNPEFGSVGVNWLQNKTFNPATSQPTKALFRTVRDKVKTGKLAMIGSYVPNKETIPINLARFIYSGSDSDSDFLYVIGKDIISNGPDFMQLKAPNGGNLYSVLENVKVNNPLAPYRANTSIYTPTDFGIDVDIKNGFAHITSDNKFSQVLTWHGYHNKNIRCIFNVGRFVFDMNTTNIYSEYIIDLQLLDKGEKFYFTRDEDIIYSDYELHPGDITTIGKVISKHFDLSYDGKWEYIIEPNGNENDSSAEMIEPSFNLKGNHRAGIVFKNGALFGENGITENTEFWSNDIIGSNGYGWTCYNQREITAYWKNVELEGFYRQSTSGVGYSKGYYLENVTGIKGKEFDPKPIIEKEIPKEAKDFIEWLEMLE